MHANENDLHHQALKMSKCP